MCQVLSLIHLFGYFMYFTHHKFIWAPTMCQAQCQALWDERPEAGPWLYGPMKGLMITVLISRWIWIVRGIMKQRIWRKVTAKEPLSLGGQEKPFWGSGIKLRSSSLLESEMMTSVPGRGNSRCVGREAEKRLSAEGRRAHRSLYYFLNSCPTSTLRVPTQPSNLIPLPRSNFSTL